MKISKIMLVLVFAGAISTWALPPEQSNKSHSKAAVRTITGCLSQGDSAKEFLLTTDDGSTWEVRSSRVALAKHVGHTIAATGLVSHAKLHNLKEDAKEAAHDSDVKKDTSEHGHMKITGVKMVSDSCRK